MRKIIIIGIFLVLLCIIPGVNADTTPWFAYVDSFSNRIPITITTNGCDIPVNYQVLLNISYEPEMQLDFDDIRFTNSSNGELPYWIEYTDPTANVWVNLSDAITNPGSDIIWMYYGNDGVSDGSDGDDTFIEYNGPSSGNYKLSNVISTNLIYESKTKTSAVSHNVRFGLSNIAAEGDDMLEIQSYSNGNARYFYSANEGTQTSMSETPMMSNGVYYKLKITYDGSSTHGYVDGNEIAAGSVTNLPNELMGMFTAGTFMAQEWAFIRKYIANEPTVSYGTPESESEIEIEIESDLDQFLQIHIITIMLLTIMWWLVKDNDNDNDNDNDKDE